MILDNGVFIVSPGFLDMVLTLLVALFALFVAICLGTEGRVGNSADETKVFRRSCGYPFSLWLLYVVLYVTAIVCTKFDALLSVSWFQYLLYGLLNLLPLLVCFGCARLVTVVSRVDSFSRVERGLYDNVKRAGC